MAVKLNKSAQYWNWLNLLPLIESDEFLCHSQSALTKLSLQFFFIYFLIVRKIIVSRYWWFVTKKNFSRIRYDLILKFTAKNMHQKNLIKFIYFFLSNKNSLVLSQRILFIKLWMSCWICCLLVLGKNPTKKNGKNSTAITKCI